MLNVMFVLLWYNPLSQRVLCVSQLLPKWCHTTNSTQTSETYSRHFSFSFVGLWGWLQWLCYGLQVSPCGFYLGATNLQSSEKPSLGMVTTHVQCPEVGFLFYYLFTYLLIE